jgi:hypothetical protein
VAVRYFCDRCGRETKEGELRPAELSIPPEPDISLDLCPDCAENIRSTIVQTEAESAQGNPGHGRVRVSR